MERLSSPPRIVSSKATTSNAFKRIHLASKEIQDDDTSSHMESIVKRKMSNRVKRMDVKLKSLILSKKMKQEQSFERDSVSPDEEPALMLNRILSCNQDESHQELKLKENIDNHFTQSEKDILVKYQTLKETRVLDVAENVYDSLEEEDQETNEEAEIQRFLDVLTYYVAFTSDTCVFLSFIVGYFISAKIMTDPQILMLMSVTVDIVIIFYLLYTLFLRFRKVKLRNMKEELFSYIISWSITDLLSSFPVSASILVSNYELSRVNLLFLIFRLLLLRKPTSAFGKWVITPNNLETNRILKTFLVFCVTIFYFAIYFRFIAVRSFELTDCLYFVVATSISVGYGDITPQDSKERLFTMVIQIVGLIFYTLFISMLSGYISASTPEKIKLKAQKDMLFDIYCEFKVPVSLYRKIKYHLSHNKETNNCLMLEFMSSLPLSVKKEMLDKTFGTMTRNTKIFANLSEKLTSAFLMVLNFIVYEKNEIIIQTGHLCNEVIIVSRGRIKFSVESLEDNITVGKIGNGDSFGESQCFLGEQASCSLTNKSSHYKGFIIKNEDFIGLIESHEEEIAEVIKGSLKKNECLSWKIKVANICKKYSMETVLIQDRISKIDRFACDLEGSDEAVIEAIKNYAKKHIKDIQSKYELNKIDRSPIKRLKKNVNCSKIPLSARKEKQNKRKSAAKEKLAIINTNIQSSPVNQSLNFIKKRVSVFKAPEDRVIEGMTGQGIMFDEKRFSKGAENSAASQLLRIQPDNSVRRISRQFENQRMFNVSQESSQVSDSLQKSYTKSKFKNRKLNFSDLAALKSEPIQDNFKLPSLTSNIRPLSLEERMIKVSLKKKYQVLTVDGVELEVRLKDKVVEEEGEVSMLEQILRKLDNIDRRLETKKI